MFELGVGLFKSGYLIGCFLKGVKFFCENFKGCENLTDKFDAV